jgi:hypothetical protein
MSPPLHFFCQGMAPREYRFAPAYAVRLAQYSSPPPRSRWSSSRLGYGVEAP